MTTITTATINNARNPSRRLGTWRAAAATGVRTTAAKASAARRHYRRPALVLASFTALDASAWHTYGIGAGLAAAGISGLIFETLGGDE